MNVDRRQQLLALADVVDFLLSSYRGELLRAKARVTDWRERQSLQEDLNQANAVADQLLALCQALREESHD